MRAFIKNLFVLLFVVVGLLAAVMVADLGLVSKSFKDIVGDIVFALGMAGISIAALAEILDRRAKNQPLFSLEKDGPKIGGGAFAYVLLSWIVTGWICLAAGSAYLTFRWAIDPATGRFPALVLCGPLTLLAGLSLFMFRLRFRLLYGFTEVAVGLTVALWQVITAAPERPLLDFGPMVGFLTAGVYVVVRGLDNVYTGWNAEEPELVVRFFRRRTEPMNSPALAATDSEG